ncbi:MAG: hypothetical protein IKG01_01215 [Lachnospiraceae bacterium]|nr:hypothetical protein [Lachnospiraceae bacterium]
MKDNSEYTNILHGNKREIIEEYLTKYDKEYIGSRNKDFMINQVAAQFENNDNPFRKFGSDYNDSMSQVWESYRRKFMSEKE